MYSSLLGDARPDLTQASEQQNYHQIVRDCRASGKLFEDPYFSPKPDSPVKWQRPTQFSTSPKFIADGASRFDIKQGKLGDCWLVAKTANLTLDRRLLERVVPPDQTFDAPSYCGAFRYNFWHFGKWIEVVIDDRLPLGCNYEPKYVQSSDPNEFWSPLLEKAYAKLCSSFEAAAGSDMCEALVDFTGGLAESFLIKKPLPKSTDLWVVLKRSFERGSLLGCSIRVRPLLNFYGLVDRHAYSITSVNEFHLDHEKEPVPMLRLRNPRGEKEFNGLWSSQSAKWLDLSESERKKIGFTVREDGEFWISYKDWKKHFTHLEICHLPPECFHADVEHRWFTNEIKGSWRSMFKSAGGHLTWFNAKKFSTNPQYLCKLTSPDKDDPSGNCTLIVSLMQPDRRSADIGVDVRCIGFYLYAAGREQRVFKLSRFNESFFKNNQPIIREPKFTYDRERSTRFHLPPGQYLIVPTTENPDEDGQFLLRTWTEHKVECQKLTMNNEGMIFSCTPADKAACEVKHKQFRNVDIPVMSALLASYNYDYECLDDDDEERATDDIRCPNLTYPGKPRIGSRPICAESNGQTMINIERGPTTVATTTIHKEEIWNTNTVVNNIVLQDPSPKQKQPKQSGLLGEIIHRIWKVKSMYHNQASY